MKKELMTTAQNKIKDYIQNKQLVLPKNYSPDNAMKSFWLKLGETVDRNKRPALQVCTPESIMESMLSCILQGLDPMKKQCYLIVYGNKLTLSVSYFGLVSILKRTYPNVKINAQTIHKGDVFEFTNIEGEKKITKHEQTLESLDKEIIGAYCVVKLDDEEVSTIMTMNELKQAWSQSMMKPIDENGKIKAGTTHDKFTQEMAKKTVISRASKVLINSRTDSDLLLDTFIKSEDNDYQDVQPLLVEEQELDQEQEAEQAIEDKTTKTKNLNNEDVVFDNETGEVIESDLFK